jgi:DNA repair protein RecN (Recombination protein N)
MLRYLSINNFILIKEFKRSFNSGMTVIIGETGSGKSIVLDALNLLFGSRFENNKYFKNTENKIDIMAEFDIKDIPLLKTYLEEHEFYADDEICILRRTVNKEGRNKCFINNEICTTKDLKKISKFLIKIHSQNETLEFLNNKSQLSILDSYSSLTNDINELSILTDNYNSLKSKLDFILENVNKDQAKLQLLNYKLKELEDLDLKENEIQDLECEDNSLSEAESSIKACEVSIGVLSDNPHSIMESIKIIQKNILDIDSLPEKENILDMLEQIDINSRELKDSLNRNLNIISIDDKRLFEVRSRLEKIYNISKNNFIIPEKLFSYYKEVKEEASGLNVDDDDIKKLYEQVDLSYRTWVDKAEYISKIRKQNSNLFEEEIISCLNDLSMEGSQFKIEFSKTDEINNNGIDKIEFLLSSNMGKTMQRMDLVASGGELSRISLAIQSIISEKETINTLVFDEIDTGIGGVTANVIGKYIKKISSNSQVICITHLPQVAVYADEHIKVKKVNINGISESFAENLNHQSLITEIAKMIGNEILDKDAIAQSKKMINHAKGV